MKNLGVTKLLFVTDQGIVKLGHHQRVMDSLEKAGLEVVFWPNAVGECSSESVREAVALARQEKVDGVLGLGGGSSMDSAKAVSTIVPNSDDIFEDFPSYILGIKKIEKKNIPVLLIPTTFGTGAESTIFAVVNDAKSDCKIGLFNTPSYAIVDPEFSLNAPAGLTASTGLDAFSHAVEALTSGAATPHSDLLARDAMERIAKWLPAACQDPAAPEPREQLALASNFAGISFSEASIHVGHSAAHHLGHIYHIPHGTACALVTPGVIELTAEAYPEKNRMIAAAIGLTLTSDDPVEIGRQTAEGVRALMHQVNSPTVEQLGVTREQLVALADNVMADPLATGYGGTYTKEGVTAMLESVYDNYR